MTRWHQGPSGEETQLWLLSQGVRRAETRLSETRKENLAQTEESGMLSTSQAADQSRK